MATSLSFRPVERDLPEFYQTLSWKVYRILEDIGASVEIRQHMIDWNIAEEILGKFERLPLSIYRFGSQIEGTTTCGLDSDIDEVFVFNELPVVTHAADHPNGTCLLLVQDQTTHPGYCKLQLVENGWPILGSTMAVTARLSRPIKTFFSFCPDKNNRLVCTFNPGNTFLKLLGRRHGPAFTNVINGSHNRPLMANDLVWAFQSKDWPACASEWLTRQRHFSWPSNEMINLCSTLGCLFVQVGHPDSDEENKLWRVSLSHQERLLVTSFNSIQLKCYILLKIIKKELIAPYIPESLSSYHMKTCVLYLIEKTLPEFWIPQNLLCCIVACLKLLSQWTEIGYCPNYFIPAENMFDRHVRGVVRQQLHQRLQHLISFDCHFLAHIETDSIGTTLQSLCLPSVTDRFTAQYLGQVKRQKQSLILNFALAKLAVMFRLLVKNTNLEPPTHVSLYKKLNKLKDNSLVPGYCKIQTQRVTALASPYVELANMCSLISLAVQQGKRKEEIWSYLVSEKWYELSLHSDSFSSKLKQATCMYMLGYYYVSLDILSPLTRLDRFSLCSCFFSRDVPPLPNVLLSVLEEEDITAEDLLKNYIVPCVCFLPTEKGIIPIALCYELKRKYGRSFQLSAASIRDEFFTDYVVVDSQFLLYFLLYLNHSQLNMDSHVYADISNMEWMLNTREVSHRETCLNILGWTYKEQGRIDRAMECWRMSIEVETTCNAAHWYMRSFGQ